MIDTDKLTGLIAENRLSKSELAKKLGITPKTFYSKMKKGVFGSDEIEQMIKILNIKDPVHIFFVNKVN